MSARVAASCTATFERLSRRTSNLVASSVRRWSSSVATAADGRGSLSMKITYRSSRFELPAARTMPAAAAARISADGSRSGVTSANTLPRPLPGAAPASVAAARTATTSSLAALASAFLLASSLVIAPSATAAATRASWRAW